MPRGRPGGQARLEEIRLKLPAAALLIALAAALPAAGQGAREFASPDGRWRVLVSPLRQGGARVSLPASGGAPAASFTAARAPFSVSVAPGGGRLIFLCGSGGQSVHIYALDVYDRAGRLLASHPVSMTGTAGEDFSADGSAYAIAGEADGERTIYVLHTGTGKLAWKRAVKGRPGGLKLSGDGRRLLALLPEKGGWLVEAFGPGGRPAGSAPLRTANEASLRAVSSDGGSFEVWEARPVYSEADGYWHARLVKKNYFRAAGGRVEPAGSREFDEEFR